MRKIAFGMLVALQVASASAQLRQATPEEAALDAQAFAPVREQLASRFTDVDSLVVARHGRVLFAYYRDDDPERLRDVQSVEKSALSALVGVALARGELASLDTRLVDVVPEWKELNADPRAAQVTVRHVLTMTAGFEADGKRLTPATAFARRFASTPGEAFHYDNAVIPLLGAVLEKASGMPVPEYARRHLGGPMASAEPRYGSTLWMRTLDMAKLGILFLQAGRWEGQQLLSQEYAAAATQRQNAGGPPVLLPYGYFWWVLPSPEQAPPAQRAFLASGYGGQMIWVNGPLDVVVAATSPVAPDSQRRGQLVQLLRSGLVAAAQARD